MNNFCLELQIFLSMLHMAVCYITDAHGKSVYPDSNVNNNNNSKRGVLVLLFFSFGNSILNQENTMMTKGTSTSFRNALDKDTDTKKEK